MPRHAAPPTIRIPELETPAWVISTGHDVDNSGCLRIYRDRHRAIVAGIRSSVELVISQHLVLEAGVLEIAPRTIELTMLDQTLPLAAVEARALAHTLNDMAGRLKEIEHIA